MKFLSTLLLVFSTVICFAQELEQAERPTLFYNYFKNDGEIVSAIDSADYIQIIRTPDPKTRLYDVEEYYVNNKPKFIGKTAWILPLRLEGQSISFYPNGHKKAMVSYKRNQPSGVTYQFFPNGKLYMIKEYLLKDSTKKIIDQYSYANRDSLIKTVNDSTGNALVKDGNGYMVGYDKDFKSIVEEGAVKNNRMDGLWKGKDLSRHITFEEEYLNGKLIKGLARDSVGTNAYESKRISLPEYKDGFTAMGKYIGMNLRYPSAARERNVQGTVVLGFLVKNDGKVSDIKVIRSAGKDLDNESIRVIKQMPDFIPGSVYGKNITFNYSIPVSFTLVQ